MADDTTRALDLTRRATPGPENKDKEQSLGKMQEGGIGRPANTSSDGANGNKSGKNGTGEKPARDSSKKIDLDKPGNADDAAGAYDRFLLAWQEPGKGQEPAKRPAPRQVEDLFGQADDQPTKQLTDKDIQNIIAKAKANDPDTLQWTYDKFGKMKDLPTDATELENLKIKVGLDPKDKDSKTTLETLFNLPRKEKSAAPAPAEMPAARVGAPARQVPFDWTNPPKTPVEIRDGIRNGTPGYFERAQLTLRSKGINSVADVKALIANKNHTERTPFGGLPVLFGNADPGQQLDQILQAYVDVSEGRGGAMAAGGDAAVPDFIVKNSYPAIETYARASDQNGIAVRDALHEVFKDSMKEFDRPAMFVGVRENEVAEKLRDKLHKNDQGYFDLAVLYTSLLKKHGMPQGGGGGVGIGITGAVDAGQGMARQAVSAVGKAAADLRNAVVGGQPATAGVPKPEMRQGAGPFDPTAQPKPAEAPQPAPVMRNAEPPRPASIPVPTDALTELRSKKFAEIQAMPAADRLHLLASFFKDKTFSATQTEPRFTDDSLTKEAFLRDTINKGLAAGDPNIKTEADLKNLFGEYQKAVKELMQPGNIQKLSMAAIQDLPSYAINRGMKSLFKSMDVTKDWTDHKPKEREPVIKAWSKTPEEVATLYDLYKGTVNDVTNRINEVASTKADDIKKESAEERLYLLAPLFKDKVFSSSQPDLMASSDSTRDLFKRLGLDENDAKAKTEVQKLLVAYRDAANDLMKKGKIENLSIAAVQDLPNYAVVRGMRPFFKSMDITKNWDGSGGNRKADQQDAAIKAWGKSKTGEQVADLYKLYKDAVVVASSDKGKFDEVRNSTVDEIEKQSAEERLALLAPIFKDKTFSAKQDKPEFKDNTEDRDTLLVDINKGLPAGDARIKKADPDPTKGDLARLFKAYRDAANELTDQKTGAMKDLSLATIQNLPAHAVIIGMQKGFQSLDPTLELAEHARPKRLKVEQFWNGKTPEEIQDLYKLYQGTIQDYTMARVNKKFESIETFQALPYQTALISLRGDFHPDPLNLERGLDPSIYDQRLTLDKRWKELGEDKQTSLAASLSSTGTDTAKAKVLFETYLKAIAELEKDMYNQTLATIKMLPNASVINGLKPRFGAYKASSWSGLDAKIDQPVILNMFKGPDQLSRKDDQVAALYDEYKAAQWAQNGPAAWGDWALQGLGGGLQNTGNGLLYGGKLIWDNPKTSLGIAVGETILEYATRGHGAIGLPVRGAKWVLTGGPGRALEAAGKIAANRNVDKPFVKWLRGLKRDATQDATTALKGGVADVGEGHDRARLRTILANQAPEDQAFEGVKEFIKEMNKTSDFLDQPSSFEAANSPTAPNADGQTTPQNKAQAELRKFIKKWPATADGLAHLERIADQLVGNDLETTPNEKLESVLEKLNPEKAAEFLGTQRDAATAECQERLRKAAENFKAINPPPSGNGMKEAYDVLNHELWDNMSPGARKVFRKLVNGCNDDNFKVHKIQTGANYLKFAEQQLTDKAPPAGFVSKLVDAATKDVERSFNGIYKGDAESWKTMHKALTRQFRNMVENTVVPDDAARVMKEKIQIYGPDSSLRDSLGLVTVGHARDWCLNPKVKPDPAKLKDAWERMMKEAVKMNAMAPIADVNKPITKQVGPNHWKSLADTLSTDPWLIKDFSQDPESAEVYDKVMKMAARNAGYDKAPSMQEVFQQNIVDETKKAATKEDQQKRTREVLMRGLLENGMGRFIPTHIYDGWDMLETHLAEWEEAYKAGANDYQKEAFDNFVKECRLAKLGDPTVNPSKWTPAEYFARKLDSAGRSRDRFAEAVTTGKVTIGTDPSGAPVTQAADPGVPMDPLVLAGQDDSDFLKAAKHMDDVLTTYPDGLRESVKVAITDPLRKIGKDTSLKANPGETVAQCINRLQKISAWGVYEEDRKNTAKLNQETERLLARQYVKDLKSWAGNEFSDGPKTTEISHLEQTRDKINDRLETNYERVAGVIKLDPLSGKPIVRKGREIPAKVLDTLKKSVEAAIARNGAMGKGAKGKTTLEGSLNAGVYTGGVSQPRIGFHFSPEGVLERYEILRTGAGKISGVRRTCFDSGKSKDLSIEEAKEEMIKARIAAKDTEGADAIRNLEKKDIIKIWEAMCKGKELDDKDVGGPEDAPARGARLMTARQVLSIGLPIAGATILAIKNRSGARVSVDVSGGINSGSPETQQAADQSQQKFD